LPAAVKDRLQQVSSLERCDAVFQVALVESSQVTAVREQLAARDGALIAVIETNEESAIPLWRLVAERALCVNTTAAGGNASLMTLGV
jgi:RHH-type proline utilization regulon transcriptional repressor/proline dehydrogenase/delta 1-pyrroline-5-carboxylate dehydrogenase